MALLLGFSMMITFFILAFQISVLLVVALIITSVFFRFALPQQAGKHFGKVGFTLLGIAGIAFIVLYGSYANYLTTAAAHNANEEQVFLGSYWKDNLGKGTVGSISFLDPILRPLLHLIPKKSDN